MWCYVEGAVRGRCLLLRAELLPKLFRGVSLELEHGRLTCKRSSGLHTHQVCDRSLRSETAEGKEAVVVFCTKSRETFLTCLSLKGPKGQQSGLLRNFGHPVT